MRGYHKALIRDTHSKRGVRTRAEYTAKYARPEDVAGEEEGREGNDSMSAHSDGFLSSSDEEDEPPTTGEAEM